MSAAALGGRTGRRPGDSGTRAAILVAARAVFAGRGYDGTSIRAIARDAGVDPALVHHYFGSKAGLFQAAVRLPVDPKLLVEALSAGDAASVGERVTRLFLSVWEVPETREVFLGLLRAAVSNAEAAAALRDLITRKILGPIVRAIGAPDADLRTTLAASHLVGLAMARYVLRIEPLASASAERLTVAVAPTIQRYFTGDIG